MTTEPADPPRPCVQCGAALRRRAGESEARWLKRSFCSKPCAMTDRKLKHAQLMGSIRLRRENPEQPRRRPYG